MKNLTYTEKDIKVITDPSSVKDDESYKYLYIFDLRDMPFKKSIGEVYPRLMVLWGNELHNTGCSVDVIDYKDFLAK
jgi:hypothetical protein